MKKKNKKTSLKVAGKTKTLKLPKKAAPKAHKKKKKTAVAFSAGEIREIKDRLMKIKTGLTKTIEDKQKYDLVENDVGDQIDEAAQSLEKEVLFELSDNERQILDDVEAALRKMENNKYGKCEHCGTQIDRKRLRAIPHSRYCIACQVSNEKYR